MSPVLNTTRIWLRSQWNAQGIETASYSLNGTTFTPIGDQSQLAWDDYRGDRVGIFSYNPTADRGYLDVDSVTYDVGSPTGDKPGR